MKNIIAHITEFRHKLHRIPELAGKEVKTSALIRKELAKLPLEILPPFLGTDVVAILHGKGPGRNVTLRADIDALALEEKTRAPYASSTPGMMHACGHDGHAAMLLGAAIKLSAMRDKFNGTVRFVFQPGEENWAMGRDLVAAGALENPKCDFVTALHGMPRLAIGKLATRTGAMMASCAHFAVKIKGKGGHSSRPDLAKNPVVAAAAMILALENTETVGQPAVKTVCQVSGGMLSNVIPDTAEFSGTMRSLSPEIDAELETVLRDTVNRIAAEYGVKTEIEYDLSYPVTVNHPEETELARQAIRKTFGEEAFVELPNSSLGAEDFAYYLKRYPGVYVKVGVGEKSPDIHNSHFDFSDEALRYGVDYFVEVSLAALAAPQKLE